MNTFNLVSNLFSPRPLPPSIPTQDSDSSPISITPSQDSTPSSSSSPSSSSTSSIPTTTTTSNDTVYITARRGSKPGESPRISISSTPPVHLLGIDVIGSNDVPEGYTRREELFGGDESGGRRREAENVPLPESPVGDVDLDWDIDDEEEGEKASTPLIGIVPLRKLSISRSTSTTRKRTSEELEEDLEGERRLQLREKERILLEASSNGTKMWPLRFGVSLYVLLKHFFSLLGFSSYRSRTLITTNSLPSTPTISFPPTTTDTEESSDIDEKTPLLSTTLPLPPPTPPPLSRSSTPTLSFFLRRSPTPPSLSPSLPPSTPTINRLPRLTPKTLVLDLDETLIHSTSRPYKNSSSSRSGLKMRVVEVVLDGRSTVYTVYKRPWVDFFLRKVSSWYTVIIFTASLPEYADPVIDWLDGGDGGGGMVGGRLFRSDCLQTNGAYVKDLSVVDSDLSKVCLVDNSPASYAINQANGIPIEGWINDPHDECLLDLLPMLDSLRFTSDVRRVLGLRGFGKS